MLRHFAVTLLAVLATASPAAAGTSAVRPALDAFDRAAKLPGPVNALAARAATKAEATGSADVRARGARVRIASTHSTCPATAGVVRTATFRRAGRAVKLVQRFAGSRTAGGVASGTVERRGDGRTLRSPAPAALLAAVPVCPAPAPGAPAPAPAPAPPAPAPAPAPAPEPSPSPAPQPTPQPEKPDERKSYYVEFSYHTERVGMRDKVMSIEGTVHPVPGDPKAWKGEGWLRVSEPRDKCPNQWYPNNDPMAEKLDDGPAVMTGQLDPYGKGMWFGAGSHRWVAQIGPVTTPGEEYVYIDDVGPGGGDCGALIKHTQAGWFTPTE